LCGELEIGACLRHLRDLETAEVRGLYWDVEKARHAIDFFPSVLTITEGAMVGKPFELLPWHKFVVGSIFGWRKAVSGRMRFRQAWLETGKGQAKSPLMAAVGLYMAGFYGIKRSKVFAIGQDRKTANVLFMDAVAMCRAPMPPGDDEDYTLEKLGVVLIRGALDNAWKLEFPDSQSLFQALANGEAVSGPKPSLVAADEIHEFKTNTSIELWKQAIAKMPGDALIMLGTNTPSSVQLVGTDYSEYFQKVALCQIEDDEAFSFIARVDKADRKTVFETPAVWAKALPALDITFPRENIDGMVRTAQEMLSTAMSTKRLYFGIPTGAVDFWISEDAWIGVQGTVDEAEMRGSKCWLSLDLSKKNDLTALTACWEKESHFHVKTWYWTAKDGLADRARQDQAPYVDWVEKGYMVAVPGPVIDKSFVAQKVADICSTHDVQMLAFDAAGMIDFLAACTDIGFDVWKFEGPDEPEGLGLKLVSHAQGKRRSFETKQLTMPTSIERLEDRILMRTVTIESSPVTYSCAANAQIDSDGQNNRAFEKRRQRGRIDGIVTIAMAVGAASNDFEKSVDLDDFLKNGVMA
jgi:phage terminase large subunit-like protein